MTDHRDDPPDAAPAEERANARATAELALKVYAPQSSSPAEPLRLVVREREYATRPVHRPHGRAVWP